MQREVETLRRKLKRAPFSHAHSIWSIKKEFNPLSLQRLLQITNGSRLGPRSPLLEAHDRFSCNAGLRSELILADAKPSSRGANLTAVNHVWHNLV